MEKISWLQIVIGFFSGGAFGAFIKQYFDNLRNRIQPVGRSIEIKPFYDSYDNILVNSQIILTGEESEFKFSKLYTGTIKVVNNGRKDYEEFILGITCPENIKIVYIKPNTIDRHHESQFNEIPKLENQISSFDVILKPFNRNNSYIFDILLTSIDNTDIHAKSISLSSPHSIKWVDIVTATEVIMEIAKQTVIGLGPLYVGLRKSPD